MDGRALSAQGWLIWTPPGCASHTLVLIEKTDAVLYPALLQHQTLRALMNFAKEVLISSMDSKSCRPFRFASPRSDRSIITRVSPAQHV